MGISVIIPTYKEPEYLRLCISSALSTMVNKDNQILVYVDGTGELEGNQKVIEEYKDTVIFAVAAENRGMCVGMNYLIARAKNRACLVVNDDHVFPKNWDLELEKYINPHRILIPGTFERNPSIFPDVVQQDFGQDPESFDMTRFLEASYMPVKPPNLGFITRFGMSSLPFLVDKYDYMALGGWDERCIYGLQADHDFFLRAKILGFETAFVPGLRFYHFSMTSVNNDNLTLNGKQGRTDAERQNMNYLFQRWGGAIPRHNGRSVELWDPIYNQTII